MILWGGGGGGFEFSVVIVVLNKVPALLKQSVLSIATVVHLSSAGRIIIQSLFFKFLNVSRSVLVISIGFL